MAAVEGFEIDRAGVAEILRSPELAAAVRALGEQVGAAARAQGHTVTSGEPLPIEVFDDPRQDRAGTTVAVRHPAGVGMEAHHGVLRRAAGTVGLDVEGLRE
ncbi:hypothetical protein [Actinokineospora iranica]|uniref:Uncharacterized protein n=1 Tax=Actinokineospora iranica TaxID=1271860 RepID=A0A1G6K415_9PSEU|nr:hypothetical protein [Actinokineospora iranica]SDC25740.1 hypothetical protein SAMN05216174_101706 [Actinokineospora iranica]